MTQIGLSDAVVIFKTGQVWGGGCGTEFEKKEKRMVMTMRWVVLTTN